MEGRTGRRTRPLIFRERESHVYLQVNLEIKLNLKSNERMKFKAEVIFKRTEQSDKP